MVPISLQYIHFSYLSMVSISLQHNHFSHLSMIPISLKIPITPLKGIKLEIN